MMRRRLGNPSTTNTNATPTTIKTTTTKAPIATSRAHSCHRHRHRRRPPPVRAWPAAPCAQTTAPAPAAPQSRHPAATEARASAGGKVGGWGVGGGHGVTWWVGGRNGGWAREEATLHTACRAKRRACRRSSRRPVSRLVGLLLDHQPLLLHVRPQLLAGCRAGGQAGARRGGSTSAGGSLAAHPSPQPTSYPGAPRRPSAVPAHLQSAPCRHTAPQRR